MPWALALIPLYAAADRAFGMDRPPWAAKLPWKGPVLVLLALGGYLTLGLLGALLPLAWAIWRTPAWKVVPGSSATPRSLGGIVATFVRHSFSAPGAALMAFWAGGDWKTVALGMFVFTAFATALAVWLASQVDHAGPGEDVSGENAFLELIRGAAYGGVVVAAIG